MSNHGLAADALGPFPDESPLLCWSAGMSPDRVIVVGDKNFGENNGHVYARRYRPEYYEQRVARRAGMRFCPGTAVSAIFMASATLT